ncbi:MAG: hypothetical protein HGA80_04720 [Candidatus Omnitrophica bacterium]|nr:hypothetical protein [Candidatus Omnitrophota bacterium]
MKVSVKKIDALRREMHFEVPKERVTKKMEEVLNDLAKHANIAGFRKGKAPKQLVRNAHGKLANEETLKSLIPEVYQEGVLQEKLDPIDYPSIDQVDLTDGVLKFRATFDIRPEVEVKDYRGLKVTKKTSEVSDEELAKTLDYVKKSRGLEDNAEMTDEIAKSMGFPGLEDFKKALRRNLEFDKERQNRQDVENQLVEELFKKASLHVPQSLVIKQLSSRMEDFRQRMKQYGAKDEDVAKRLQETEGEMRIAAEKDVKLFLILQKIAQEEKIDVKQGESLAAKAMEFLLKEAKWEETKS